VEQPEDLEKAYDIINNYKDQTVLKILKIKNNMKSHLKNISLNIVFQNAIIGEI